VPLAPDLGRGEHATGTAHVTEGSLTGTVGSSTRDTGNTGNGTTSSPGLGGSLMTSLLGAAAVRTGILDMIWLGLHSIGLTLVLVHASVDGMDNVRPNGSLDSVSYGFQKGKIIQIVAKCQRSRICQCWSGYRVIRVMQRPYPTQSPNIHIRPAG
jgi:hypothetical protein